MGLESLNHLGLIDEEKAVEKLKDLKVGEKHKIISAKRVSTRYGPTILLELENAVTFLPKRFAEISKEDLENFNSGLYYVVFEGMQEDTNRVGFGLI